MDLVGEIDRNEEEKLIEEIELEMRKMYTSIVQLFNNQPVGEISDPLEKCLITNYCYASCLLNRGIDDKLSGNEDALTTFKCNLQKELDFLTNDIDHLIKKVNSSQDMFLSIDNNISNIKEMTEASSKSTSSKKNMNDVTKNIKLRFRREKSDLKGIITTLFADNLDVQDLIARIIEHHFKEGFDKYLELDNEDNITENMELLRRTKLFEINPNDIMQIKLADLM